MELKPPSPAPASHHGVCTVAGRGSLRLVSQAEAQCTAFTWQCEALCLLQRG